MIIIASITKNIFCSRPTNKRQRCLFLCQIAWEDSPLFLFFIVTMGVKAQWGKTAKKTMWWILANESGEANTQDVELHPPNEKTHTPTHTKNWTDSIRNKPTRQSARQNQVRPPSHWSVSCHLSISALKRPTTKWGGKRHSELVLMATLMPLLKRTSRRQS